MNHNLLRGELRVKKSIPSWNQYSPMITISNQACFTKVCVRGLQKGVLGGDIVLRTRILPPSTLLHTPHCRLLIALTLKAVPSGIRGGGTIKRRLVLTPGGG